MRTATQLTSLISKATTWLETHFDDGAIFSYTVNGRTVTVHSIETVEKLVNRWEQQLAKLQGRGRTFARIDE